MKFTDEQKKQLVQAFLTAFMTLVLAVASILGYNVVMPPAQSAGQIGALGLQVQRFQSPVRFQQAITADGALAVTGASTLTGAVSAGSTLAVTGAQTNSSTLDVAGASTLTGAVTTGAALTIGTLERWTAGTSITVTNGVAFTPTASYQPITAAGAVTPTITVNTSAGIRVCVVNTSAQAVLIQDTGTAKLGGDRTLNQFDVLCVLSDGTNWIEVGYTDN